MIPFLFFIGLRGGEVEMSIRDPYAGITRIRSKGMSSDGTAKSPVASFCVSQKPKRGAFSGVAASGSTLKLPRLSFLRSVKNSSTLLLAVSSSQTADVFSRGHPP